MTAGDTGLDSIVAGVRCRDVLDSLSDFLDGSLSAARNDELRAHLQGCDRCTRFGGEVAETLMLLRKALHTPPDLAPERVDRLRASVRRAQSR
jgi:anti-sigma factor RsiW